MKNKVSALMDGELSTEEVANVIQHLKKKNDSHEDWKTYHLIGDAMRQSSALSIDISQNVSNSLVAEPALLAPKLPIPQKRSALAFSIAASVVVIIAGWLGLQTLHQPSQIIIADNNIEGANPIIPVVNSRSSRTLAHPLTSAEINDYLLVHGEFSPGTAMRGTTFYVHPVMDPQDRYRR